MFRRHHTPRQPCGRSALALTSAAAVLLLAAGPAAAQVAADENPAAYADPASADGEDSVAVGSEAQANGDYSLAVGVGAIAGFSADDRFATAIGFEAQAGFWSTALGTYAEALGETSAAFGYWATAAGESSTALGAMSTADGMWSTAIGGGWAVGDESIAIGMGAQTDAYGTGGDRAIVIGSGGLASGHDSIAVGYMSITDGDRAMALGTSADMVLGHAYGALAEEAVAIGYGAFVTGKGSVAVGVGSVAMDENVFSIGRGGGDPYGRDAFTRRLVNVSDGEIAENSSDAVTGGQLFAVRDITTTNTAAITTLNNRMGDAETALAALEHGAAGDLPIAADNTAAGDAPDASGQDSLAVGWGSAAAGANSVAIAGGAADGAFAMAIGDSAQASEDLSIALGHGAGAHALGGLALGAGAQATARGAVALGSGSVADEADTLSIGAAGFERRLVNVSDGLISETSTDAVTGGQMFATQSAVASALGAGAEFDAAGLFSAPEFIILGSNYDNLGGALGALNTQVETNVADIEDIRTAGGGGGAGDDQSAEIAALRAQVEALSSALDRLEQGAIAGGEATGDPSTAIGFAALASGQHSTAIGGNASATGDLSTALGQGAVASGDSSLALGQGASAAHDNAVAIGQGVATTRANQVAMGSADHTYTLAGLSSDASLAAQTGPVRMVTADASGNLATMDMQPWFDRVDALEGRADVYDERWRVADDSFDRHADGVATALALGGAQVLQPGQTFSMSANIGHFDGSSAVGFGAIGRLNERVSVNVGVGTGFRTGTVAGRAGISFGW